MDFEALLIFGLVAGIFALLAASPILSIIAIVKVRRLERELRSLRDHAPAPVSTPQPEPAAVSPPPSALESEPTAGGPVEEREATPPLAPKPAPAPKVVVAPPLQEAQEPREPKIPLYRRIDWERWVGVRGAAVLGGIFLALSAILLFKHAFENQWIGNAARCWMGVGAGVAFIAFAHFLRGRAIRFAPAALEGAGLVAFHASIWAAYQLYGFLSLAGAFPLMAAVTALACFLAMRNHSQLTAVLGLVGGFTAAWLLQNTQEDRPLGLFGWILLLDLGLIFVGKKRGWPLLGFAALLGTFFFETLWVFRPMDPERMAIGLGILAVFVVLFVLAGQWAPGEKRKSWVPSQVGAVLFPFVFAVYFARNAELNEHVYPTASLLALLAAAACFLARTQGMRWMPRGAASGCVAVIGVWMFATPLTTAVVWELGGVAVGLAVIFHLFAEWEERLIRQPEGKALGLRAAATLATTGWLLLLGIAASYSVAVPLWPFLSAFAALALVLVRQSFFAGRAWTALLAGAGAGLGFFFYETGHLEYDGFPLPDPRLLVLILVAFAGGLLLLGSSRSGRPNGRTALQGVGLFAIPACLGFLGSDRYFLEHDPWLPLSGALALGVLTAAASTKLGSRTWFAVAVALTAMMHALWWVAYEEEGRSDGALSAIVLMGASAALFTWWPLCFAGAFRSRVLPWIVASVAVLAWYTPLHELYIVRFSDKALLTAPLVAGLLVLTAALRVPSVLR
ncbi:MAG: DUF2339 domain-containing protein, partial [Planctomycetota bacterium]|nr:DUF2339 domain-containing protein [Planctomycetota bacterium]